jgi:hypothetical protein
MVTTRIACSVHFPINIIAAWQLMLLYLLSSVLFVSSNSHFTFSLMLFIVVKWSFPSGCNTQYFKDAFDCKTVRSFRVIGYR